MYIYIYIYIHIYIYIFIRELKQVTFSINFGVLDFKQELLTPSFAIYNSSNYFRSRPCHRLKISELNVFQQ